MIGHYSWFNLNFDKWNALHALTFDNQLLIVWKGKVLQNSDIVGFVFFQFVIGVTKCLHTNLIKEAGFMSVAGFYFRDGCLIMTQ